MKYNVIPRSYPMSKSEETHGQGFIAATSMNLDG